MELLDKVLTRLSGITDGTTWDNPAGNEGEKIGLHFYKGGLPPKRSDAQDGEDFPFLAARILAGSEEQNAGIITVRVIGGLYTWGDIVAGQTDVTTLLTYVLSIAESRGFSPYQLGLPIKWRLGDEDGQQPHAYYYLTADLPFKRRTLATFQR